MVKQYKINEEQVKAILNYLVQRPYQEVFQGVQMLTSLEEIVEEKEDKKE